jgi:hypothetical protein
VKATIRKMLTVGGKVQMWSTLGEPDAGFVDLAIADWANYILTMTETPVSSYAYVGSWPATLTAAGWYVVDFYDGATIAGTLAGTFLGYWDGATFGLGGADVRTQAGGRYKVASVTGNWATVGTWADSEVPAAHDNIIVRSGVTLTVAATLDLGQFGTLELQGTGVLNIGAGATVASIPAGWVVNTNDGIVTYNFGIVVYNYGTTTYNKGEVLVNYGLVGTNYDTGTVVLNQVTLTTNYGVAKINNGAVVNNISPGIVELNLDTVTNNTGIVNTVQTGSAAALAAYNSTGVAKEASVGAIATILSGITSLAHWLRGLYNKRVMNSEALTEIQDTTGTFDPTTDSNEALAEAVAGVQAGSGLTAQQTRDAMKLAPSTGTPIAGSIDAELDTLDTVADAIKVKTDQIGSANVTVTSPVAQSGEITIYIGNDYLLSEGRALTWAVTGVEVAFLDGAAVTLRILRAPLFYRGHEPETLEADAEFEGDVVVANEEATITVELLAADIIELDALRTGYVYQLVAKTTDNTTHTIAAGVFIAVKAIQEPSA